MEVVVAPRSSSDRGNSLPSHKFPQVAILHSNSLCQGRHVTVAATTEAHNPEASIAENQMAKSVEPVPNKCSTDGKMVTQITTVQHIMKEMQSRKMEKNHESCL